MWNILADIILIFLLIFAIGFSWKLGIKLQRMKEMGEDMTPFMKNLSVYLTNILTSLEKLKNLVDTSEAGLQKNIPDAFALKSEFDILIEHSEKIAKRLDDVIDRARMIDHRLHNTLKLAERQILSSHPSHLDNGYEERPFTKEHTSDFNQSLYTHQDPREGKNTGGNFRSELFSESPQASAAYKNKTEYSLSQSPQVPESTAKRTQEDIMAAQSLLDQQQNILNKFKGMR